MTPEGKVKKDIKAYLNSLPNCYHFWPVQAGMGARTLDVLICLNGWFVACEVKRPGSEPTPLQRICMAEIDEADGISFYATSVEHVKTALADILKEPRLARVMK